MYSPLNVCYLYRIHAKMSCIHLFIFVCLIWCNCTDYSVAHAGDDVKKNVGTDKYKENVQKALSGHQYLSVFFQKDADEQGTRAEVIL